MVLVRLSGGLGNQMFQYAAARRLAHVRKSALKLDLSFHTANPARPYRLGCFNITATVAGPADVERFSGAARPLPSRLWFHGRQRLHPYYRRSVVRQQHVHFDPHILELKGDVCLDGYWQSERYFADAADVVRAEFTLREDAKEVDCAMINRILTTTAVAVHVRRGDYVSDPATHAVHGICSLEYYERAARLIAGACQRPHFFVFSDDPAWARAYLQLPFPFTLVSEADRDRDCEDLRLMSLCTHFIIANSSFSWWGAWLGSQSGKVVVAPQRWFATEEHETRDIVPAAWIRL